MAENYNKNEPIDNQLVLMPDTSESYFGGLILDCVLTEDQEGGYEVNIYPVADGGSILYDVDLEHEHYDNLEDAQQGMKNISAEWAYDDGSKHEQYSNAREESDNHIVVMTGSDLDYMIDSINHFNGYVDYAMGKLESEFSNDSEKFLEAYSQEPEYDEDGWPLHETIINEIQNEDDFDKERGLGFDVYTDEIDTINDALVDYHLAKEEYANIMSDPNSSEQYKAEAEEKLQDTKDEVMGKIQDAFDTYSETVHDIYSEDIYIDNNRDPEEQGYLDDEKSKISIGDLIDLREELKANIGSAIDETIDEFKEKIEGADEGKEQDVDNTKDPDSESVDDETDEADIGDQNYIEEDENDWDSGDSVD